MGLAEARVGDGGRGLACGFGGFFRFGGRLGLFRRFGLGRRVSGALALKQEDQRAFGDGVAFGHLDLRHLAGGGGRHLERRLVGFELDQRVFFRDRVADRHQDGDDRHVLEIADVGNFDFCGHL